MTLPSIDATHDSSRTSWVDSANGHADFPLQNLPLGMFTHGGSAPRPGVAIGDSIVDLAALARTGLLGETASVLAGAADTGTLLAASGAQRVALRRRLADLLDARHPASDAARARAADFLLAADQCAMQLPARIGSYSDFNAGIYHSAKGGMRRGRSMDDALLPNYRHIPIAYHGRASSVRPSGTPVRRPHGQFRLPDTEQPIFGPTRKLDFELEMGIWIGRGNTLGDPVLARDAASYIAGYCLLNDWSARDIQSWETERLGPFLGKSFCTSISPWVITPEALAPFRLPVFERAATDPRPLPHLVDDEDQRHGGLNLELQVWLQPAGTPEAVHIATSHTRHLYWTPAQMVTHQGSNGCNLSPGDLLGTGTVTGPKPENFGTMLDALGPDRPFLQVAGVQRTFLEDGDTLTLRAHARREGFASIGFGDCAGRILPAATGAYSTA